MDRSQLTSSLLLLSCGLVSWFRPESHALQSDGSLGLTQPVVASFDLSDFNPSPGHLEFGYCTVP